MRSRKADTREQGVVIGGSPGRLAVSGERDIFAPRAAGQ